jgi:hypothetical protein
LNLLWVIVEEPERKKMGSLGELGLSSGPGLPSKRAYKQLEEWGLAGSLPFHSHNTGIWGRELEIQMWPRKSQSGQIGEIKT